jgi:ABC-type multidrug transport system fused ATPase/permease subunit
MGPLMNNRTRILVTHHIKLCLKGSAFLVHIEGGRASYVGSPTELRQSGQLAHIIEEDNEFDEDEANEEEAIELAGSSSSETHTVIDASSDVKPKKDEKTARILIEEEGRASGSVKIRLYKIYFGMVGNAGFWILMTAIVLGARGFEIGESWWVKTWAQSYDRYSHENDQTNNTMHSLVTALGSQSYSFANPMILTDNQPLFNSTNVSALDQPVHKSPSDGVIHLNYYLGVYCLITVSNVIIGSLRFAYLYWGALGANKKLYSDLLHRVFRAPLRFFDTTPLGRILNRFSKDFESVDSKIPTDLMAFVIQWVLIVSSAITVCIVLPTFTLPMVAVAIANVMIGINYVSSSRELKRLDSVTRSPVFSNFTETISGVATIRAFGATQHFLQVMMDCIDENVRPFFYGWSVNRWVSVRYSLSSAAINFAACAFALYNIGTLDVSLAGFGLSFVLMFADNMFWGIRQYTNVEMSFNAVERIIEFMEMDQEAPAITDLRPPPQWPIHGQIEVCDLEVKYAADLDPVLKGLTFSIKPQEKIGVVGRTGIVKY